jgi:hypothetical protein
VIAQLAARHSRAIDLPTIQVEEFMSKAQFLDNQNRAKVRPIKPGSATPTIRPGKFILAVVGAAIVVVAYLWVSTDDYAQQERLAQPTLYKQARAARNQEVWNELDATGRYMTSFDVIVSSNK